MEKKFWALRCKTAKSANLCRDTITQNNNKIVYIIIFMYCIL